MDLSRLPSQEFHAELIAKGNAYLDAVIAGSAESAPAVAPPRRSARPAGARVRRPVLDPDVLAMGTLVEHAWAAVLLSAFAVATSVSLVLQAAALRASNGPLTLLLVQLSFTAALCRTAGSQGVVPGADAPSQRRAVQALPDAVAHTALSLLTLLSLRAGSVEGFLAVTAACVPLLAASWESLAQGGALPLLSPRQRQAAAVGCAAAALTLLCQPALLRPLLLLALWHATHLADKAWCTLRLQPPAAGGAEEAGGAGEEAGPPTGSSFLDRGRRMVHAAAAQLAALTPPSTAQPQPPSPFERVMYGNALPLAPLALGVLLSGELLAAEHSIPSLGALVASGAATAVASVAVLVLSETQALRPLPLLRGVTACNAAALVLSGLTRAPSVGPLGRACALVAVVAGAAFQRLDEGFGA